MNEFESTYVSLCGGGVLLDDFVHDAVALEVLHVLLQRRGVGVVQLVLFVLFGPSSVVSERNLAHI